MTDYTKAVTIVADTVWGDKRVKIALITPNSAYPDDGFPLAASDFGLALLEVVIPVSGTIVAGVFVMPSWDGTNSKLLLAGGGGAVTGAAFVEVADDFTSSSVKVYVLAIGH